MRTFLFLSALLAFAFVNQHCKGEDPDPCETVVCQNSGTCVNGACQCPEYYYGGFCQFNCVNGTFTDTCACKDGYGGDVCDTELRARFIGSYQVYETCFTSTAPYEYNSTIATGTAGVRSLTLSNFRGDSTYALINIRLEDNNTLVIDPQTPKGVQEVSGTGYMNDTGDTIVIDYEFKASSGSNVEICKLKYY